MRGRSATVSRCCCIAARFAATMARDGPARDDGRRGVTAGDDGVYAADLTEGMRVHVDDDGTVATVVAVTRVGKKLVRAKLRDDANPRVTLNAEFAPDEVVLTAEPGEADAIDLDKTSSVA